MRSRTMTWHEFLFRSGQELTKRWDRLRYALNLEFPGPSDISLPGGVDPEFFFSSRDIPILLATMRERFPREVEQTIEQAEQICKHEFDLLGYERIVFGPHIDWHSDLVHGKTASRRPWYQIPYLDFEQVGDSKIIWELNRHQHFVSLAKAYRLTNDARFAKELFNQWLDWQKQNRYPLGINWASNLEVAFRSLAWLWTWHLIRNTSAVPDGFATQLSKALALSGDHLEKYLSTYFSPNTHLLGEGVALFFLGVLCPHLRQARRWKARGWQIIENEARRQVRRDGMYFEQSVYYHAYALDFLLHARILASRNGVIASPEFDGVLLKMLEFLAALSQAGPLPRLGDDDGGRLFNPRRNGTENLLDPLSTGAALFKEPHFKAAVDGPREETLWLLGIEGLAGFDSLPRAPRPLRSVAFPESGIYVLADAQPEKTQMIIDAGPQGSMGAGHGHADALNICFSVDGRELLTDAGTYCYVSNDESRNEFRGTAAHNTLQVDGEDQSVPRKPFSWRSLVETSTELWVASEGFDLFRGSHTGYTSGAHPVVHRRHVFHSKSNFWLVRDVATGEGEHSLRLSWHFAPHVNVERRESTIFTVEDSEGARFALLSEEDPSWVASLETGWWSPVYGKRQLAPAVRFHRKSSLPAELCSIFVPAAQSLASVGPLRSVESGSSNSFVRARIFDQPSMSHYIIFAENGQTWRVGDIESDARFACCSCDRLHGKYVLREFCLSEGSFLKWEGELKFATPSPVPSYEWKNGIGMVPTLNQSIPTSFGSELDLAKDRSVSIALPERPSPKGGG